MKIALVGYMGAGKTTVSRLLAAKLDLNHIDLDTEIEKQTGYTITETIFNKGELFFRKLERQKLEEVLADDNFVLSTGGGTPCYYNNIETINENAVSIYLRYGVNDLYARLEGNTADRPLIAHLEGEALKEYIGKHLFERNAFYDRATFTLIGSGKTEQQIVNEINALIHE